MQWPFDSFRTAGLAQSGRQALLRKDFEIALQYFTEAIEKDPDYRVTAACYQEHIGTFLGRAQYATGRYRQARQSLQRAVKRCASDHLARLYLGATMIREGDDAAGLSELKTALQNLHDWIEEIVARNPFEAYWDPNREIRTCLIQTVALIERRDRDPSELMTKAEWIGQEFDAEIDRVRRDESRGRD